MTKEEIKQWLRNQIDSCIKTPNKNFKDIFYLHYNKSYLRALKLSKITGQPVNENNFKGGEKMFWVDSETKYFGYYKEISVYIIENYSKDSYERLKIVEEVLNEYEQYKGYNII